MFFGDTELTIAQTQTIVRGMYMLAASDGLHPNEMALIEAFYKDVISSGDLDDDDVKPFATLIKEDFNIENAKQVLDNNELREAFLRTALFLSMADGALTEEEKKVLFQLSKDLEVSEDRFRELHTDTIDVFMQQFTHVKNIEKLAEISAALSL